MPTAIMNDDGPSAMRRELHVTFRIPKEHIKSSNMSMSHIIAAVKTRRLKDFAGPVWEEAIREQFGVEPLEPDPADWEPYRGARLLLMADDGVDGLPDDWLEQVEKPDDVAAAAGELAAMERAAADAEAELARLDAARPVYAELRAEAGADAAHRALAEWKEGRAAAATALRNAKTLLRRSRTAAGAGIRDWRRKAVRDARRAYNEAKKRVNADRRVFPGQVVMMIRCNNVTSHFFDAPNLYPTVKAIQDAGTLTGVLWEDDNNSVILRTDFYGGSQASVNDYVLEVIVREVLPGDFTDPFGPKLELPPDEKRTNLNTRSGRRDRRLRDGDAAADKPRARRHPDRRRRS